MKPNHYIQYKNLRWWVALPLALLLLTIVVPFIILSALLDLVGKTFDIIFKSIGNLCGKAMCNVNKWVNQK